MENFSERKHLTPAYSKEQLLQNPESSISSSNDGIPENKDPGPYRTKNPWGPRIPEDMRL